jgi:hypothetical protein
MTEGDRIADDLTQQFQVQMKIRVGSLQAAWDEVLSCIEKISLAERKDADRAAALAVRASAVFMQIAIYAAKGELD